MTIRQAVEILWDYNKMHQTVLPADVIIACGSSDVRIAEKAGELFKSGLAPLIVCSGNHGVKVIRDIRTSEAQRFSEVLHAMQIPEENILLEEESTNTGDNITFSMRLLKEKGIVPKSVILVHKPYMERRTIATFEKQFPNIFATVTSPNLSFNDYQRTPEEELHTLNLLVGDMDRVIKYPAIGYMTAQPIAPQAHEAFICLKNEGYTKYLLK